MKGAVRRLLDWINAQRVLNCLGHHHSVNIRGSHKRVKWASCADCKYYWQPYYGRAAFDRVCEKPK